MKSDQLANGLHAIAIFLWLAAMLAGCGAAAAASFIPFVWFLILGGAGWLCFRAGDNIRPESVEIVPPNHTQTVTEQHQEAAASPETPVPIKDQPCLYLQAIVPPDITPSEMYLLPLTSRIYSKFSRQLGGRSGLDYEQFRKSRPAVTHVKVMWLPARPSAESIRGAVAGTFKELIPEGIGTHWKPIHTPSCVLDLSRLDDT